MNAVKLIKMIEARLAMCDVDQDVCEEPSRGEPFWWEPISREEMKKVKCDHCVLKEEDEEVKKKDNASREFMKTIDCDDFEKDEEVKKKDKDSEVKYWCNNCDEQLTWETGVLSGKTFVNICPKCIKKAEKSILKEKKIFCTICNNRLNASFDSKITAGPCKVCLESARKQTAAEHKVIQERLRLLVIANQRNIEAYHRVLEEGFNKNGKID